MAGFVERRGPLGRRWCGSSRRSSLQERSENVCISILEYGTFVTGDWHLDCGMPNCGSRIAGFSIRNLNAETWKHHGKTEPCLCPAAVWGREEEWLRISVFSELPRFRNLNAETWKHHGKTEPYPARPPFGEGRRSGSVSPYSPSFRDSNHQSPNFLCALCVSAVHFRINKHPRVKG